MSAINENIYDMILISKIKERTGPKKLKKIMKNLRNFAGDDIKEFPGLKFKSLKEKKEEEKELESENSIIRIHHYIEDFKKSNSKSISNNDGGKKGENTSATNENEKEVKQFNNFSFSEDE